MSNYYNNLAKNFINIVKKENRYRNFIEIKPLDGPLYRYKDKKIINWCSNDYNRSIQNRDLVNAVKNFISENGIGSGGTRNISGTTAVHRRLESKVADLHNKQAGLLFNSGYVANLATLESLGKVFPNTTIYSDEQNHASIIKGIQLSKCNKIIFPHNDMNYLEDKLKNDHNTKIIVVESMYSMDGSITNFEDIVFLKKKYNAFTFIDEIHTVGLYGDNGSGLCNQFNVSDDFDIIMGGFGKGFGTIGGYITGNSNIIDSVRSTGSGFIFTTSIPPSLTYGSILSIKHNSKNIKDYTNRRIENIKYFLKKINDYDIQLINNNFPLSHIKSVLIGDSIKTNKLSNILLNDFNHYLQPINFPTVPKGTERFRVCITHDHTYEMIDKLLMDLNLAIKLV